MCAASTYKRDGLLITATFLSLFMSVAGFGMWVFGTDPREPNLFVNLFWIPTIAAFPVFLFGLFWRRALRSIVWILVLANWCGQCAIGLKGLQDTTLLKHIADVLMICCFSVLGEQVIVATLIALLVDYSHRRSAGDLKIYTGV